MWFSRRIPAALSSTRAAPRVSAALLTLNITSSSSTPLGQLAR